MEKKFAPISMEELQAVASYLVASKSDLPLGEGLAILELLKEIAGRDMPECESKCEAC